MRALPTIGGIAAVLLGMWAAGTPAAATPVTQGGPALGVVAGQGDGVVKVNEFVPAQLRVAVGTTVTWTVAADEAHTISFLAGEQGPLERTVPQPEDPRGRPPMANPFVWEPVPPAGPYDGSYRINSGPLGRDQSFSVTFSKVGAYPFLCTFHPRVMSGIVEVVEPGGSGITTQQRANDEIATHMARDHEPQIAEILAARNAAARLDGVAGDTWFVRAGTDWRRGHLDIDAFLPDTLTVRQGDTVVWAVDHLVPHTVTFLAPGQDPPDTWELASGGSGEPRLVVANRGASRPGPVYDGSSYYSSGQIGGDPPSPRGIAWALTFDTPGAFEYLCLIHGGSGMRGQLTVVPR